MDKAIIDEKNNHRETEVIEPDVKEKNEDKMCNQIDVEKKMNRDEKQPTVQVNPIEHEVSDVLTHDVHNEDKQNQTELQTDNILTVDRIEIAGEMVSWGTQTDVLELESMAPIQPMTVVEYSDGKKHEDDTDNDSIPSSASQIGQTDRSTTVKQSANAGLDMRREIYHEVMFPPVSSTAVMPSSKAVMPEPTESTGKERTLSLVDLCTSKTEVKKKKTLPTKAYKLPPACTFL